MSALTHHSRQDSSLSAGSAAEDLFSSLAGFDDLAGDDDLSFDDEDSKDMLGDLDAASLAARKGKRVSSTAEKKATHNAVERARRESLNGRFLVLADLLPGMTHVKRASKAAIVNKSIELIKELQTTESRLAKENEALKSELAAMRARWGMPAPFAAGMPHMMHMPPVLSSPLVQNQTLQQQQQAAVAQAKQDALNASSVSLLPGFGNIFAHGLNIPGLENNAVDANRSGSASPASQASALPLASSMTGTLPSMPTTAPASFFGNGYFDVSGLTTAASPTSHASQSPAATGSGLSSQPSMSNTAPSPASTHSVQTPANAFSPSSLPNLGERGTSPVSTSSKGANAAVAAFDSSSDATFLASQFGPRDLVKAQQELQNFLAYQQRMASSPSVQSASMPFMSGGGLGTVFPFPGNPNGNPTSPFCGSPSVGNVPAWQMMMAQQAALTAYGGASQY